MTAAGYALLGLTAIVAALVAVLAYAVLRFAAAARQSQRSASASRSESLLLASALEDAFSRLKAQERAMAARAEASERLNSQIVASLTSGLIVVDSERQVQIVNPAARRTLRLGAGEVTTDALLRKVPALEEVLLESLSGSTPVVRRRISFEHGGDTVHLGVTVSPLDIEGRAQGAICLFSDLTSVVVLEEQLRMKETLARLGELTAGLAHEFRNGLATIHGYGRLLDPAMLPNPQRQYVEGIRSETQSLGEIVTNFLNFARPEPMTYAPISLRSVIARAAEDVAAARVELAGDFGTVTADEVLLRQVFSNLFRNSVDACSGSGRAPIVTVDAREDAHSGMTHVTVRDDGPGIPAEALTKLFQPFFTMRRGGTGLGLAIVQKIVVSHNGRISAGNHPDGGAVFTLVLPQQPIALADS